MDSFTEALRQAAAPMAKAERAAHKMRDYVSDLNAAQKRSYLERELLHDFYQTLKNPQQEGIPFISHSLPRQDLMLESMDMWLGNNKGLMNLVGKDVLGTAGGTGAATIRVDLVPHMWNLFLTKFPALDLFPRRPANGLSHTWVVSTDPDNTNVGFVDDLGTSALIGKGAYTQLNTLIPIGIAERGATLRAQLAQEQSGMTYDGLDAVDLELQRGAWAMSKLFQKCFYQGEKSTASKTGTDEFGTTYTYGFDGLRAILGNPSSYAAAYFPGSVNNSPIITEVAGSIYDGVNNAVAQLISIGADPGSVHMSATQARKLAKEGSYIARQDNASANGMSYGAYVTSLVTVNGELPVYVIPGDSIGSYTAPASSAFNGQGNVEDIYVLDNGSIEWRYLGPSMPFVIELPMGLNPAGGTDLANRFLIAWLAAPIFNAPVFNAKVRNLVAG